MQHSSSGRLWVGRLRPSPCLKQDLWDLFDRHGEVLNVQVSRSIAGPDLWAKVTFADPAAASRALALDGALIPAVTIKGLRVRDYGEDAPRHQWQQPPPQQHRQGWGAERSSSYGSHGPAAAARQQWGTAEEEEDEEEEGDPIVELWVGNLCSSATRTTLRQAFSLFGLVISVELLAAPNSRSAPGGGLQFAFVQLPASAAEVALQELDGLCVYELSGSLRLKVKQSTRSLIPLLHQEQQERRQQHQQQQHGGAGGSAEAAPEVGEWGAVCEDGSVAPLQGVVRKIKKLWVAEGPPNRQVWVGNVGGQATEQSLNDVFSRFGGVQRATLFQAPGYQNSYQFGIVELGSAAEAEAARSALQGATGEPICDGKPLKVRYCWPRSRLRRLDAGSSGGGAASTGAAASQQQPGPGALCCAACGAAEPQVALKLCSGCHATRYCSCECQLASWEAQHHAECGRLAQLGGLLGAQPPQVPPELTKLLLAALQQPLSRQGQLVRALVAHQPTAAAAT